LHDFGYRPHPNAGSLALRRKWKEPRMLPRISAVFLGGLVVWITGCGTKSPEQPVAKPAGGVGVVDLDLVAKRLGRDIEMENLVQERVTSLNNKLTTLQGSMRRLYDEKREKLGDDPTEEQLKDLQAWQDRTDAQLLESKRKAEVELGTYKQALVDQFREQAKPFLREIAAARGMSIVIPKNNALLLTVDPAAEITDDVAAKMPPSALSDKGKPDPQAARKPTAETSAR
jgi:Skp family chaperone for outer membrane proteins